MSTVLTTDAIRTIDLNYLGQAEAIAAYLLLGPDGPVLIETGPGSTVDALTSGLAEHGVTPADIRDVLVTHIHFDHAGASGWMARHGARIHVHEFGARHLIDPSKLVASATRIYGDRMDELWGELIPIPAEQVNPISDGAIIDAGGLQIRAIETPGHARHHHAYAVETDLGLVGFTGDAAATCVAACPSFISVPTPPPEFDLATWLNTLDRLEHESFSRIYPTHFGAADDVAGHWPRVRAALEAHVECITDARDAGLDEAGIRARYAAWFLDEANRHGLPAPYHRFYVKDSLAEMNVSGILRWLSK